jgi:hypothetical protein
MKWGIIYMAFGDAHFSELEQSLATVRHHMPDVEVTVYTDSERSVEGATSTVPITGSVYDRAVHIDCLERSPYETTLCLDTDTWICESLEPVAGLMERFDVAGVHAPHASRHEAELTGIPIQFRTFNAGVFFLKRSACTDEFLALWKRIYRVHQQDPDPVMFKGQDRVVRVQPSLREAVYRSDVRPLALPVEYNFRIPGAGYIEGAVKVLYGRAEWLPGLAEKINTRNDRRFCMTDGRQVKMVPRRLVAGIRRRLRL